MQMALVIQMAHAPPWSEPLYCLSTQGLKAFQADEGVLPDIVSFATNYWDIAAL